MIGRRLLGLIPVLLIVSFGVFMLSTLIPGDAAVVLAGGENTTEEGIAKVRDQLGLDDPLLVQYGRWLGDAAQFDFGTSLYGSPGGQTVFDEIKYRMPVTLSIMAGGLLLAVSIGVPLGIFAGMRPGTLVDRICTTTTVA